MTGFPARTLRSEFGPTPVDRHPLRDPARGVSASIGQLLFGLVTGMSLVSDLVELDLDVDSGGIDILRRKEAWNPDALSASGFEAPTLNRTGAGVFTITYPTTVPDVYGDPQDVVLVGGTAVYINTTENVVKVARVFPTEPASNVVTVRGWSFGGGAFTAADGRFLVVLR